MLRTFACFAAAGLLYAGAAHADEGGVSFWAPGLNGSLAALPGTPGWSFAAVYYHPSADADAGQAFPRGGRIDAGISADADTVFFGPTYTFAKPLLGGQAALSLVAAGGSIDASIEATLTGPGGETVTGRRTDSRTAFGDLYPQFTLKWNRGVHNSMVYVTGDIPVGAYDPDRLANLGIGHAAIDGGAAYTYLNPKTGWEFSATAGLTYNFENNDTDYRNGMDLHVDWGASRFISEKVHVGLVGYAYQQITGDSGSGATLGDFKSRVYGIGPQVGYMFKAGRMDGYLNLKGYSEFGAENRPEGWSVWISLAFTPGQK